MSQLISPPPTIMKTFRQLDQSLECQKYVDDNTLIRTLLFSETIEKHHSVYTLKDFEYRPRIEKYHTFGDGKHVINTPTLMMKRFDIWNIYEMMNSLINTYLVIKMFGLDDVFIVFNDTMGASPLNDEMFSAFTTHPYIYSDTMADYTFNGGYYVLPASHTSIITTKTKRGPLRGRGRDHHCKSTLLRSFVEFWKEKNALVDKQKNGGKINVVWSSRGPHTREGVTYTPRRAVSNEIELVKKLENFMDVDIDIVDFGLLSAKESVRVAMNADIMIGVHGAGLTWSMFMRPFTSTLIELFGGDRANNNRHYHNLCSLSGVEYQSVDRRLTPTAAALKCDDMCVESISKLINNYITIY